MENMILDGSFASIHAGAHPGLRSAKIVYIDDQPNSNGYGVEYADFEDIKKTIIGTPLKMKFLGDGVSGHKGSIPIGYIHNVVEAESKGIHQLIIDATLFADDYPDEIEWLDNAYAEGKAPGVSFEITYHNSVLKDGVNWIKGLVARAATFVRTPAYGSRTALLALASDKTITAEQFIKELSALAKEVSPKIPVEGGNNRMEEEIINLKAEIAALKITLGEKDTALAEKDTQLTDKDTEIETLNAEKTTLEASVSDYRGKEILSERQAALAEAGIDFEIKPERITKMADDEFTEYVADLKLAVSSAKKDPEKKLLASHRGPARLPKFESGADNSSVSVPELAGRLKRYSRSQASDDTE